MNVAYASTCNAMGVTVGHFLGYSLYIMLHWSPYASMRLPFLPGEMGNKSLDVFMFLCGGVFIVTTTLVMVFKSEVVRQSTGETDGEVGGVVSEAIELAPVANQLESDSPKTAAAEPTSAAAEEKRYGLIETYALMLNILRRRPMILYVVMLLTSNLAFAATDAITNFKLVRASISTDKFAGLPLIFTALNVSDSIQHHYLRPSIHFRSYSRGLSSSRPPARDP